MYIVKEEELKNVQGGGINIGLAAGISAFGSFLIGVIDGLINPKKCNR